MSPAVPLWLMRRFWILIPLLAGCGLAKKQPVIATAKPVFENQHYPVLYSILKYDYLVKSLEAEQDLTIYPLNDSGYSYDYTFNALEGRLIVPPEARMSANQIISTPETDGITVSNTATAMWLSRSSYAELRNTGKTKLILSSKDTGVEFHFVHLSPFEMAVDDSVVLLNLVEIASADNGYYLSFVADPDYPLIINKIIHDNLSLINAASSIGELAGFEPGPGCVLTYRIIESGVNEYLVNLRNTSWKNNEVTFEMSGKYSGSYEYEFNYTVVFRDSVLKNPSFMVPVISGISGEKVEETNWIFLGKNEVNRVIKEGHAMMNVPHDAEDPREYPEDYTDTQEYREALNYYLGRNRTDMTLHQQGRAQYEPYTFYERDLKEDANLPALRLYDMESGLTMLVLNRGSYPLMLYYNDQVIYEIILESAGSGID